MPIDPSIPLRAVQPRKRERDPIREYGNMLQISELQDQRSKRNAFEQAAQGAIGPDGQIDYGALKGAYASSGNPEGALQIDTMLSKRDANARDAELGQLRVAGQRAGLMGQVFGSVRDQDSYSRGRSFMQKNGIDVSQIPEQYDPTFVADAVEQSMSAKERIELALRERRTVAAEQGKMGANVSVNTGEQFGKPPPGWRQYRDADGVVKMEKIEGGPAAEEDAALAEKERLRQEGRARAGGTVIQDLQRALDMAESNWTTTGAPALLMRNIPQTDAQAVEGFVQSALSNIGLDTLQAMREASPTGGALGQVPIQQQKRLEQVLGSLDTTQRPEIVKDNIKRVINLYKDIVYGTPQEVRALVEQGKLPPDIDPEVMFRHALSFDEFGRPRQGQPAQTFPAPESPGNQQLAAPPGVDPQIWQFMTPEERALFQ